MQNSKRMKGATYIYFGLSYIYPGLAMKLSLGAITPTLSPIAEEVPTHAPHTITGRSSSPSPPGTGPLES